MNFDETTCMLKDYSVFGFVPRLTLIFRMRLLTGYVEIDELQAKLILHFCNKTLVASPTGLTKTICNNLMFRNANSSK